MTKQNKVLFLLFAVVAAIYAPSLFNDFVYDDIIVIQGDSTPLSLAGLKDIFTKPHYPFRPYYRPVVRFSFVLQNNLPFGDAPLVFHLINVLLAGLLAIFIYKLLSLRAFKLGNRAAFWSALLVVAHPVTSSSVYPAASGRETLMPVLFMVISLYYFLRNSPRHQLYSVLFFVLSLFSKEQAIVLPVIFVCADLLNLKNRKLIARTTAKSYIPYLLAVILYLLIRLAIFSGAEFVPGKSVVNILAVPLYALQQITVPYVNLRYEPVVIDTWLSLPRLISALAMLSGLVLVVINRKDIDKRPFAFFALMFLIALLPNANFLQQDAPFSERYILFSMISLTAALAYPITVLRVSKLKVLRYAPLTLMILLSLITVYRNQFFRNNISFAQQWIKTSPEYYLPHYNLARAYQDEERFEDAITEYEKAIYLNPNWPSSYRNLGSVYLDLGEYEKALVFFDKYRFLEPYSAVSYYQTGLANLQMENLDLAEQDFMTAIKIQPAYVEAYNNLGIVYELLGENEKAIENYRKALTLKPGHQSATENLHRLSE